jgi:hypothetical protein
VVLVVGVVVIAVINWPRSGSAAHSPNNPLFPDLLEPSRIDTATAQMKSTIRVAVFDYVRKHGKNGDFPSSSFDLVSPPQGRGILFAEAALDPWGHPYSIEWIVQDPDVPVFRIVCQGPNGNAPFEVSSSE